MKTITRYKFLREGLKSENGDFQWKMGKWEKAEGELEMCENGFHCSKEPYDAFSYVQGELLAVVEVKGKHLSDKNKECWEQMRVVKVFQWTKKQSVEFAIFSAELVLKNFEKEYPEDKRPREAIEAARKVLFDDSAENIAAAESAARSASSAAAESAWSAAESAWSAAWSAWSARSAESAWSAWSAARSAAESAPWSAWSAAESAAESAWSAAWSAWSARSARSAARSAAIKKIQKKFKEIVEKLEPVNQ